MLRKGKVKKLSTSELKTQSAGKTGFSNGEKLTAGSRKGSLGEAGAFQAGGRL